jgi:hypothetical protein
VVALVQPSLRHDQLVFAAEVIAPDARMQLSQLRGEDFPATRCPAMGGNDPPSGRQELRRRLVGDLLQPTKGHYEHLADDVVRRRVVDAPLGQPDAYSTGTSG